MSKQIGTLPGLIIIGAAVWGITKCMGGFPTLSDSAPPAQAVAKADVKAPEPIPLTKAEQVEIRKKFASQTEENFLRAGMSVDVTTRGADATTLHFKYALVTKAFVYQTQHNTDFVDACRQVGFKTMVLTDGFRESFKLTF